MPRVTLYSAALGLAISQACYATVENHECAVLRQLLGELNLKGVLHPVGRTPYPAPVFRQLTEQGADFFLTVKANQMTLHRQIRSQFQGKRKIPFVATDQEIIHGRTITWTLRAKKRRQRTSLRPGSISWIVEVTASGSRDGKSFQAIHLFLTNLRTTSQALLQLVSDRWSIEGWNWNRDTQHHEDAHRHRGPIAPK